MVTRNLTPLCEISNIGCEEHILKFTVMDHRCMLVDKTVVCCTFPLNVPSQRSPYRRLPLADLFTNVIAVVSSPIVMSMCDSSYSVAIQWNVS